MKTKGKVIFEKPESVKVGEQMMDEFGMTVEVTGLGDDDNSVTTTRTGKGIGLKEPRETTLNLLQIAVLNVTTETEKEGELSTKKYKLNPEFYPYAFDYGFPADHEYIIEDSGHFNYEDPKVTYKKALKILGELNESEILKFVKMHS